MHQSISLQSFCLFLLGGFAENWMQKNANIMECLNCSPKEGFSVAAYDTYLWSCSFCTSHNVISHLLCIISSDFSSCGTYTYTDVYYHSCNNNMYINCSLRRSCGDRSVSLLLQYMVFHLPDPTEMRTNQTNPTAVEIRNIPVSILDIWLEHSRTSRGLLVRTFSTHRTLS
jgi:hypothetical protein